MTEAVVVPVTAAAVRPLRSRVLRPGRPESEGAFPGDDDERAVHLALRIGDVQGEIVAVGSLVPEAPPWLRGAASLGGAAGEPAPVAAGPPWRIRGMATEPDLRGRGLGSRVLAGLLEAAARAGGGLVWCNARMAAESLYRRAGFEVLGDAFELPGIGPHLAMHKTVPPA